MNMEENLKILLCKHTFHIECIESWLGINKTCPVCRTEIIDNVPVSEVNNYQLTLYKPLYFNNITPYEYHQQNNVNGISYYSFALSPEEYQPSGTLNFSRLDNLLMDDDKILKVCAKPINVLRITSGVESLMYPFDDDMILTGKN